MDWKVIIQYRETDTETIPLDEVILVTGLQSLGITPVKAETNGSKLRVHFEREECMDKYQILQKALAGILPEEPLLKAQIEFFLKGVHAKEGWQQLLAMMRNYSASARYIQ